MEFLVVYSVVIVAIAAGVMRPELWAAYLLLLRASQKAMFACAVYAAYSVSWLALPAAACSVLLGAAFKICADPGTSHTYDTPVVDVTTGAIEVIEVRLE